MANTASALKEIRKIARRRVRNRVVLSSTRTTIKTALSTLEEGDAAESQQAVLAAMRALDKAASKGVLHKNNAARRKSRLAKKLKALDANPS